jgi:hypothetical protein
MRSGSALGMPAPVDELDPQGADEASHDGLVVGRRPAITAVRPPEALADGQAISVPYASVR